MKAFFLTFIAIVSPLNLALGAEQAIAVPALPASSANTSGTQSPSAPVLYDADMIYTNPLLGLPESCAWQVDFFRVVRPILPLVNHIVVGAKIRIQCDEKTDVLLRVYGASKGSGDLAHFSQASSTNSHQLEYLGSASGAQAVAILDSAVAISERWQAWTSRAVYLYPRMLITPIFGRICNDAAQEVIEDIRSRLSR